MRIIFDESVHYTLVTAIRDLGFQILSIAEEHTSIADIEITYLSLHEPSIIITQDKDFGELVFKNKVKVECIILLRFEPLHIDTIRQRLINYLSEHLKEIRQTFTVITLNKTRIRPIL